VTVTGSGDDSQAGRPARPVLVEVRNRFGGSWSHGFEIVESTVDANGAQDPAARDQPVMGFTGRSEDLLVRCRLQHGALGLGRAG